jgi:mono/diheme cytochrome c family protein
MLSRTMRTLHQLIGLSGAALLLASCGGDPNSPGLEYMPDMYRSPAVEAYVDYGQDPYYFEDSVVLKQRSTQSARMPVAGTIAFAAKQEKALFNFPYPYPNTVEGYEAAGLELRSPIAFNQENVDKGKVIYDKFCTHCHGATGKGDGSVVNNGGYPQPPAYDGNQLGTLPEGKMFHSLMYGKNIAMGSHAGQLNKEERWLVIQYVKYLQNGGKLDRVVPVTQDSTAVPALK